MEHDVFVSYARADAPVDAVGERWTGVFARALEMRHQERFGRRLNVFCDTGIESGERWRCSIRKALRQSRLFVAVLSQNFMDSDWCRQELEEYIRIEHAMARGKPGVRPIYFATVAQLESADEPAGEDRRLADLVNELRERQRTFPLDWRSWADEGPRAVMEIDAERRLETLGGLQSGLASVFPDLAGLDREIALGLDDAALAEQAQALGNIEATYRHFVGRASELAQVHEQLTHNQLQIITALHGLGGQGKTALARQYAYAYSGYYAAGGRWEAGCEGQSSLALVMDTISEQIARRAAFAGTAQEAARFAAVGLTDEQRNWPDGDRIRLHLQNFRAFTVDGWQGRLARWRREAGVRVDDRDWEATRQPRMLIILDNVDRPALLGASGLAAFDRPDWLEVLVTTRLDPQRDLGAGGRMQTLAVRALPLSDAVALLDMLKPFGSKADEDDGQRLAEYLGMHTLSVELSGAYAASREIAFGDLLMRYRKHGLTSVDELGRDVGVDGLVRHQSRQMAVILQETVADLSPLELDMLALAAQFPPDAIREDFLRNVVNQRHDGVMKDAEPGFPDPWRDGLARLEGRRLLLPVEDETGEPIEGLYRLHRVIGDQMRQMRGTEEEADRENVIRFADWLGSHVEQHEGGWRANPALQVHGPTLADLCLTLLERGDSGQIIGSLGVAADIEGTTGRLAKAIRLQQTCLDSAKRLLATDPDSAQAARDVSVSQERLGDYCRARGQAGDAERALEMYEASLETDKRLLEDNPDNVQAARDVSVSQNSLGDFYHARGQAGDAKRTLKMYEASLDTLKRLFEDNPDRSKAARDVSVSQERLGDFYSARDQAGDAEKTFEMYEASLKIRERLLADNPGSAEAARDVSVSQNKLGDFYRARSQAGDAELALEMYKASLKIREPLLVANPKSAEAARDVSLSQERLGDFYSARGQAGDAELALEMYNASLTTVERLLAANPDSAGAARDVAVSLTRLGDHMLAAGDIPAARRHWQRLVDILQSFEDKGRPMDAQMKRALDHYKNKLSGM